MNVIIYLALYISLSSCFLVNHNDSAKPQRRDLASSDESYSILIKDLIGNRNWPLGEMKLKSEGITEV